ncbi:MAG: hypothetical protein ACRDND_22355 [Streptosporangiaceae bacterium]
MVSLIGAADSFAVSTMPAADATRDVITRYELPAEMTGMKLASGPGSPTPT